MGYASFFGVALAAVLACSCTRSSKVSVQKGGELAGELKKAADSDVEEVRKGLPEGAKQLAGLYKDKNPQDDVKEVRDALERARNKVQDLRVAKSTFFALADLGGTVIRNDREQDQMAGKSLFSAFPELRKAASGSYVETRGSMPEAAERKGTDGQWVAAHPIVVDGKPQGLYVTGWAWSAYAYRLENAARSAVRAESKEPLVYVYVVVADAVYGAPTSPDVNADAIREQKPLDKIQGDAVFSAEIEVTGRDFGLVVRRVPALGPDVALALLRSET
jgi:hypothetical protein